MHLSIFQIVVLAVFGALAIAAMIIFAVVVGGAAEGGLGAVTIWGVPDGTAMTTVIRQLSDEDSRLKQVVYVQKSRETFQRELTDALAAAAGPDMFIVTSDNAELDGKKVVTIPFSQFSRENFRNTFVEAADPFIGAVGVRAVPFAVDPLVLFWNRDMLASRGYALPPKYWEELFDMAQKITERNELNSIVKAAVPFGEYRNVSHAKDIVSALILQAGGSITARNNDGKLGPALTARVGETQQASESAIRFFTEFANPSKTYYTWSRALPESRQVFAAGDLALYVGFASEEPLIRRLNPNLNFSVAPLPQVKGEARVLTVGRAYGFAIPLASKNPEGALTIAYLLASVKPSSLLSQALGIPSARRDVLSQRAEGNDELFNKQAIVSRAWTDPDPQRTDIIFRDMIESITSGQAKLSEAIQRAESSMAQLIGL